MEQNQRVQFKEVVCLELPREELKNLYVYLALFQYKFLRESEYDEKVLLRLLNEDMKKLLIDAQMLVEQIPNNHALHKIVTFFELHHKQLKTFAEKPSKKK